MYIDVVVAVVVFVFMDMLVPSKEAHMATHKKGPKHALQNICFNVFGGHHFLLTK